MHFLKKPVKFFLLNATKPWEDRLENLESLMHMDKVMSTDSEYWSLSNETIPGWFYQMCISMGIALFLGFTLILIGSI